MRMSRRLMLTATLAALAAPATAQDFPTKHVTIVVPYGAGGATDGVARVLAEHMSTTLGKPVVVENIAGGAGSVGATRVARAEADGHTLMLNQMGLATIGFLLPQVQFDAATDFAGIGLVVKGPGVIAGHPSIPANSIAELKAWIPKAGRPVRVGHPGPGTYGHLSIVLLASALGATFDMIPYRGGGQAMMDNLAGHIDLHSGSVMATAEHIRSGALKGFGLTSAETLESLPQVPSLVRAGYPELDMPLWHGLYAPKGTPRPVIEALNRAVKRAVADPKVAKTFAEFGLFPYPADQQAPEGATDLLRSEIARWGAIIKANKISAN